MTLPFPRTLRAFADIFPQPLSGIAAPPAYPSRRPVRTQPHKADRAVRLRKTKGKQSPFRSLSILQYLPSDKKDRNAIKA